MNVAAQDDRVLRIERRLEAKPDRVFAAWTEPEQIAQWFGPGEMTVPSLKIDARAGGEWTVTMRSPDGQDRVVSGVYREFDPPKRLAFTWGWLNDGKRGHETEVIVELVPDGDGTLLKLTQSTFASTEQRDMHNMGWGASLGKLTELVKA